MTERRKYETLCPRIEAQLDRIGMTPSERAEARHALELGMRAAGFIVAIARGLRWFFQTPIARRVGRRPLASIGSTGASAIDAYHQT